MQKVVAYGLLCVKSPPPPVGFLCVYRTDLLWSVPTSSVRYELTVKSRHSPFSVEVLLVAPYLR